MSTDLELAGLRLEVAGLRAELAIEKDARQMAEADACREHEAVERYSLKSERLEVDRDRLLAIEREARAAVKHQHYRSCGCHRLFAKLEAALEAK